MRDLNLSMAVLRDLYPPINSLIRRKKIIDALKVVKSEGIKPWGRATQAKVCGFLNGKLIILAFLFEKMSSLSLIFSLEAVW